MMDAAVTVFARRGYHQASMDEIAEVAGVSKPMVYAYLGAKEDVFAACARREAERLLAAVTAAVAVADGDAVPPPEDLLWHGLHAFFQFVHEHRDGWAVLHRQARGEGVPSAADLHGIRGRVVDVVATVLADAKAAHGERAGGTPTDLRAFAHALVGAVEVLAGWMVDEQEQPAATASRLMNLVWVGFDGLLDGEVWRPRSSPNSTPPVPEPGETPLASSSAD